MRILQCIDIQLITGRSMSNAAYEAQQIQSYIPWQASFRALAHPCRNNGTLAHVSISALCEFRPALHCGKTIWALWQSGSTAGLPRSIASGVNISFRVSLVAKQSKTTLLESIKPQVLAESWHKVTPSSAYDYCHTYKSEPRSNMSELLKFCISRRTALSDATECLKQP